MTKQKFLKTGFVKLHIAVILALVFSVLALVVGPKVVDAGALTSRKLALSTSQSNTSATWTFTFTASANTVLKGISFQICTSPSGSCATPGSWTNTSATFGSLTYNGSSQSSWALDNAGAGGAQFIGIKNNAAGTTSANPIVATINTVTNPTLTNTSFYVRINTYTGNTFTTLQDGPSTVAAAIVPQISVSATVDESLTFCVGTSGVTSSSCGGATGTTVPLYNDAPANCTTSASITVANAGCGTSQLGATTNAGSGYAVTYTASSPGTGGNVGALCTDATHCISAVTATDITNASNVARFGFNCIADTHPISFSSNVAGAGSATCNGNGTNYSTTNSFTFLPAGDTLISNGSADDFRLFTLGWAASISNITAPGSYSDTITFIATPTF